MKIKVFTTGGSIDKIYSTRESNFVVDEPQVAGIFQQANVVFEYEVAQLFRKDSLELSESDRWMITQKVRAAQERYILITHGTDTMIATALELLGTPDKVIVLTGAMQPAAFKDSDAAFNVGSAVVALQTLPEGVYVVMNGKVFDPRYARKNLEMDRFERTD
jgi:L-asparaginase